MLLNIAVVEDSREYMSLLLDYLARFKAEGDTDIRIFPYTDGALLLEDYKTDLDIILLDIKMPLTDGMSAAEEIRKSDPEVTIIFITNAPQYAIRGYAVAAFDFIVKPIDYIVFRERLNKAVAKRKNKASKFITINMGRNTKKIEVSDIYYIESRNHTLVFHTTDGEYRMIGPMRNVEIKLADCQFFRTNSWYLINLRHVDEVRGNNAIVCGRGLELSRRRKNDFMRALSAYLGSNL